MIRFTPNTLGVANLRGDLFGGITTAIIALPLALAFGVASGAGPIAGLYGAICLGFFAAWFGGTPAQPQSGTAFCGGEDSAIRRLVTAPHLPANCTCIIFESDAK